MTNQGAEQLANGPVCAALVSAGAGCAAMGAFAVAGDGSKGLAKMMTFYGPTGPLSGVTTVAIVVWLAAWVVLSRLWRDKTVAAGRASVVALALFAAGLLLTFPPFGNLLIGK